MKPRYSIVRIDNQLRCPTNLADEFKCPFPEGFSCVKCAKINGDSKEQLIRKVAQAIKRKLKGGLILRNTKINETYNIQKTISAKAVAKEIVEFLGVKE